MLSRALRLSCTLALTLGSAAHAQSTAFTYQGRLTTNGAPASGLHDLRFSLFNAATGGVQVGSAQCVDNLVVANGLFIATLDFGQSFSTPNALYLQIELRADTGLSCAEVGGFTTLGPRQAATPAPFATHAKSAFGLATAIGSPAAVVTDTSGNLVIDQATNTSATVNIDSGATSPQYSYVHFSDRGSVKWGFGKDLANSFYIDDAIARRVTILPTSGNVGIGTAAPAAKLHVDGSVRVDVDANQNMTMRNGAGSLIYSLGGVGSGITHQPRLSLFSPVTGAELALIGRSSDSGNGIIVADDKNFRVPNPADPTTDIWYCCPEGPEAAMYVRGTATLTNGRGRIDLPEHFRNLAFAPGMTVQLTPLSINSKGLAVIQKDLDGIIVSERKNGTGTYEFDWRVEAVRKGHEDYEVIRPWRRSDPDENKAWQNRKKWIAERRAHGNP
jgi:hypothetical protein